MIGKIGAYSNNFFWLLLTYLSVPLLYLLIFLQRKKKNSFPKILIIQTAKIGDLVCSTPVFREIKKKFPSALLTALVVSGAKGVLENNPRIDEIMLITDYASLSGKFRLFGKLRKEKYDWAFNLLPDSFSNIIAFWSLVPHRVSTTHRRAGEIIKLLSIFNNYRLEYKSHTWLMGHYLNLLRFIGIKEASEEKEVFFQSMEEKKALDFLAKNNLSADDLLIGMGPVPGNKLKQWDLSKFAALADLLAEKLGAKIIFTGSPRDSGRIEEVRKMMKNSSINASDYFGLSELPALLKKLKLFISADSGPLYIANALLVPVVDIGGSYDVKEQAPSGGRYEIVRKELLGCSFMEPDSKICQEGIRRCLKEITPEEVFEAARDLLFA